MRNLGGIIIIDFIDMLSSGYRKRVLTSLECVRQRSRKD
ncbi:ribonuclease E/G [Vibrio chagasii]|nr:ribonuclease E/G [Vibrio chagasii]